MIKQFLEENLVCPLSGERLEDAGDALTCNHSNYPKAAEIPWMFVWPGFLTLIIMLATGAMYFRRMERVIVDVI